MSENVIKIIKILSVKNKNYKCQETLADKLVEKCTENIEEMRLVEINSTECNSVENKWKKRL